MVKEWDYEAGKKSKKNQITNFVLCLMAIIGLFSVIYGVSLHKTG